MSVEAAAGDGNGKRILRVGAAGFDALIAENALRIVAYVKRIVDLYRLRYRLRCGPKTARIGLVAFAVALCVGRGRKIEARGLKFEHHLATRAHARRVGFDDHSAFGKACAGGNEHARTLQLDDADATGVDRRERFEITEGRRLDAGALAGIENRRSIRDRDYRAVDSELYHSFKFAPAEAIAFAAV